VVVLVVLVVDVVELVVPVVVVVVDVGKGHAIPLTGIIKKSLSCCGFGVVVGAKVVEENCKYGWICL
jgi:hypothetical protein